MSLEKKIREYIQKDINEERVNRPADSFWTALKSSGTTLWLDTGRYG
ncbi:MAG: hypothetical protein U5K32_10955 [Bacteroidales bacterium]|nr:hypothetical protein [Bacteroidales bacterium]